jgi:hypothetical protein
MVPCADWKLFDPLFAMVSQNIFLPSSQSSIVMINIQPQIQTRVFDLQRGMKLIVARQSETGIGQSHLFTLFPLDHCWQRSTDRTTLFYFLIENHSSWVSDLSSSFKQSLPVSSPYPTYIRTQLLWWSSCFARWKLPTETCLWRQQMADTELPSTNLVHIVISFEDPRWQFTRYRQLAAMGWGQLITMVCQSLLHSSPPSITVKWWIGTGLR